MLTIMVKRELLKTIHEMIFPVLVRPVDYGHGIAFFETAENLEIALRGFDDDNEFEIRFINTKEI